MRSFGIVALSVMLGGCASVTRGTTENISISSTPSGVEAVVSGMEVPTTCTTPCSVVVKRNADISITFQKEGYEPQIVPLSNGTGNVLVTGDQSGFAYSLDPTTGAIKWTGNGGVALGDGIQAQAVAQLSAFANAAYTSKYGTTDGSSSMVRNFSAT